jgi:hypothetical protein
MATPSDAHLLAFGRIIHNFASVETGIKLVLSGILDTFVDSALVSFAPYGAGDLRNVAKSLAKQRLKPEPAEKFCCIVGDWYAFNGLRNLIAHSRWTTSYRPGAIKPRRLSIREGRADWYGDSETEDDYTAPELETLAEELNVINERLKKFGQASGLFEIIERNMETESPDMSESSGSPTNNPSK